MTSTKIQLSYRINFLIDLANQTIMTKKIVGYNNVVDTELYSEFMSSSLSFINNLYGHKHSYFIQFTKEVNDKLLRNVEMGRGILKSIKSEIDNGWLTSIKGIVSAEIFSDILEMAEHLLQEKYKDPAAVMIGSVLEEHLRQLCIKNEIPTNDLKNGKAKKADLLNSELGEKVYSHSLNNTQLIDC